MCDYPRKNAMKENKVLSLSTTVKAIYSLCQTKNMMKENATSLTIKDAKVSWKQSCNIPVFSINLIY